MDTRVTSTKRTIFPKRFFPNPNIFLLILDELEKPSFWENSKILSKGLDPWIHSNDGGR
jgi:hypothetical protein